MLTNSVSFTKLGNRESLYTMWLKGYKAWDSESDFEFNLNSSSISIFSCLVLDLQCPPLQANHLVVVGV